MGLPKVVQVEKDPKNEVKPLGTGFIKKSKGNFE
jgi:hypothetical protein